MSSWAQPLTRMHPSDLRFRRECRATARARANVSPVNLDAIAERRGYPCMVVSDNGTELTSNVMLAWQQDRGVE